MLLLGMLALGDDRKSSPKIDEVTRMQLVRAMNAEIVYIRRSFPMGYKGLIIKNGTVSPNEQEVTDMVALYGPAVKPGDRARITAIEFKSNNKIIFEINGGPKKKQKWYDRVSISTGNGTAANPNQDTNLNARGSSVTLEFDKYVPMIGPEELKKLLYPVFDFNATSAVEAYLDTIPPKAKEAIKNKQVLVGMNREMVTYAIGRPPKKYREQNYEEWIYGTPPDPVQFVRFVGDEVVQLEIMKVDGQKIVRTEKEVDLKPALAQAPAIPYGGQTQSPGGDSTQANKRPTLKRPGEATPPVAEPNTGKLPLPGDTQRGPLDPPLSPGSPAGAGSTSPGAPTGIPPH